jgi:hypothetical protein
VKDRLKLPLRFDVGAMRADLRRLERATWVDHYVKDNYEGTWSVLPLRAPAGARHPIATIYSDPTAEFADTPLLAQAGYFQEVLAAFQCPLYAVRLMNLTPGSAIKPHSDHDLGAQFGKARLHVPVTTNPRVEFWLRGELVVLREGECWYLDLSGTHSVTNGGETDRVHLVLDVEINPWLEEQLAIAERNDASRPSRTPTGPASSVGEPTDLTACLPFKIRAGDNQTVVDWCYVGDERFTAPFFSDTIRRCRRRFEHHSVRTTSIELLSDRRASHPGVSPTAFIFHGSRCGSTLLAQMAAAMPRTIVLSEAEPIDQVLRAAAAEQVREQWLVAVTSALAQPRFGEEHLVVKLDAWHVLQIELVQRAFPGVPSVFLYRRPTAVVESQLNMPGIQMLPGTLDPSILGLDLERAQQIGREEYASRFLGAVYGTAATAAAAGRLMVINYSELPARGFSKILEWCRPDRPAEALERLHDVARFDAKTPSLTFEEKSSATPSERVRDMAERFADTHYDRLEAVRRLQSG